MASEWRLTMGEWARGCREIMGSGFSEAGACRGGKEKPETVWFLLRITYL